MAITLKSNSVGSIGFIANGNSGDLSGCETVVAAVTGKSIYVEKIAISSAAAINLTIGEGEAASAVETALIGPIYMAQNSNIQFEFNRKLKLTAAKALTIDASGAGNVTIIAEGVIS
jgi:hypothetical protein